ncbi:class I SAM-dependent DNA methyltransferase [Burkholderia cenocepacia]|uniref:class I SAM-dependent DNA methyltransferase n=1 Tax=Burkholderia cenocepacia TaxID=95486 RepID=UPI002657255D|nr:N-6 DNA methylase [Burkholderia cenocepacia]MDN7683455.1 N-6 DNA methylase [Burkholderia cenocepacia]
MAQKIGEAYLSYTETIWKTADTLRGAGIKESDFPSYMMPFFALMLLESRLRRFKAEKIAEFEQAMGDKFDSKKVEHREWLELSAKAMNKGYHPELLLLDKGLRETCAVPGGNFLNRLMAHLKQYDPETRRLLGLGYAAGTPKFLDIQGKASDLFSRPNSPLYAFAQKWAAIDLTRFSNSEVTTIEEHIKRRWGDISAETAGEQYTPMDVIELAADLIVELRKEGKLSEGIADIYDMACGGGNFLFATEDALRSAFPSLSVRTRGQELNDALYALAAIEARFREDAHIERENTLTNDLFLSDKFDVIVANPPYGLDWKDSKSAVEADASGRFEKTRMPPVSDGQLLFLQHAAFHLSETGVATIVHNGSTLFSGDAGSGESQTRIWLLQELDIVEAIVQLPRGEFFNTDISTYLWVLNKSKPKARKGRVILINAEACFSKLKRNLNKKNCEIDAANRKRIVAAFKAYQNGPISKVVSVEDLLYNKVELQVHRHDEDGRAISEEVSIESERLLVTLDDETFEILDGHLHSEQFHSATPKNISVIFNEAVKYASSVKVQLEDGTEWSRVGDYGRITLRKKGKRRDLGLGRILPRAKVIKSKSGEFVRVDIVVAPLIEKDFEVVSYSKSASKNNELIALHLDKWVREPYEVVGSRVGCEINFNHIFPRAVKVDSAAAVMAKLREVNADIQRLESEFASSLAKAAAK